MNFGALVGGGVNGYKAGLDLQDAVNQKKMQKAMAERVGKAQAEIKAHENDFKTDFTVPAEGNANGMIKTRDLSNSILPGESGGMPDASNQVATRPVANQQVAQIDTAAPVQQSQLAMDDTATNPNLLNDSIKPVALAEGGLVNASTLGLDSASMMNAGQPEQVPQQQAPAMQPVAQVATPQAAPQQVAQGLDSTQTQQPQQAPTPKQRQAYYSRAAIDKNLYDGLTDDAVKYGDGKAAMQYFKASFDTSQKMIKDNLANAQREFEQFGDLSSFKDLYNHAYPDSRQVSDIQKDDKGNYVITSVGNGGKPLTQTYSTDQVKSMLLHFDDTEGLWKAQAASVAARQKEINARDDDIVKEKAKEKAKGVTLSAGAKYFGSDGIVYDNPKDDTSVSETELAIKAAKGDQEAVKALDLIEKHKQTVAREGRAPAQPKEKSFEAQAYEDWAQEPANKGKGKNQYLKEKANWKTNEGGLDSVTTATETTDPKTLQVTKESRTTHVPKVAPKSADYQGYIDRFNKFKGNPEAQAKLTALAKSKGIVK